MAQQKHCVVYRETDKSHLKLVGKSIVYSSIYKLCAGTKLKFSADISKFFDNPFLFLTIGKLYDQCQDTLVQFGTFLGSTMTVDEYVERLPSIHSMLQDNHIHADVAFFLARPMFAHAINVSDLNVSRACFCDFLIIIN